MPSPSPLARSRANLRSLVCVAVALAACHARDADAPRPGPEADAAAPTVSAASVSPSGAPSSARAPCPKLPDAAEAARKLPCARGSDCALAATGCCAPCGEGGRCDYAAMPRGAIETFGRAVCPSAKSCPACATMRPPELVPFCRAGLCEAVDLPTDDVSACERDADCAVRDWACCTACDASPVFPIALRRDAIATYDEQVCALAGGCPRCKSGLQGYRARCDATTRHCVVD